MQLRNTRKILSRYSMHSNKVRSSISMDGTLDNKILTDITFIFICYTNRSGSNFLAEALASDRQLNIGEEFLNFDFVIPSCTKESIGSFQEYFSKFVLDNNRNGKFVSKISCGHLNMIFLSGILKDILENSKFIFIERADKLSQAVSMSIAAATLNWVSYDTSPKPVRDLNFSRDSIDRYLDWIIDQNACWERFFAYNGIKAVRLIYEQFVENPSQFLNYISRELQLNALNYIPENIRTERQSTRTNRAWRTLYLDYNDDSRD